MIVVIVQLWPKGDKKRARTLGTMGIANVGGTKSHGDYKYVLTSIKKNPWKEGNINRYPRLRKHVWHLIKLVLQDALK